MTEEKLLPQVGQQVLFAVRRVIAPEGLSIGVSSFEVSAKNSLCGLFVSSSYAYEWASELNRERKDKAFMYLVDEILLDVRAPQ